MKGKQQDANNNKSFKIVNPIADIRYDEKNNIYAPNGEIKDTGT